MDQNLNNLKKEKYAILGELNALKEKEMGSDDGIQTKAASASASTPSAPSHQDVGSDFMEIVEIKGVSWVFFISSYISLLFKYTVEP